MNKWKILVQFCWYTASFMCLILFYDHFVLKVDNTTISYITIKSFTIISILLVGAHAFSTRKVTWHQEAYALLFFVYSFYGMAFIDITYSFSFVECFILLALGMRTSPQRYILVNCIGLVGVIAGHYLAQEPVFIAAGHSYKPHSMIVSFIFFFLGITTYFFIYHFQNKLNELNEKFALIGKQSSFLMHEIKTPLSRVLANSGESVTDEIMQDIRRDSEKISALVESVEILIHQPQALATTFNYFQWSEISENLNCDFATYMHAMNIKFECHGFEGNFYGNRHLLYQMLKNITLNAIEAIGFKKEEISQLTITLTKKEENQFITITNNNSQIPPRDQDKIFEPHFTTKSGKKNKGLGLALVKSIVESHLGEIGVESANNLTVFKIRLPDYSLQTLPA